MGLAFSLLQTGIFAAYLVFTIVKAVVPTSFKAPRVGHTVLAVTIAASAFLLGLPYCLHQLNKVHSYGQLKSLDLATGCNDDHLDACQSAQIVYRASTVLYAYFIAMAAIGGVVHYVYANLWPLKFLGVACSFAGILFLSDPDSFGMYTEVARALSFAWMLFQGFLVLDFAHELHEYIGVKAEEHDTLSGATNVNIFASWWRILYLVISAACLAGTGYGMYAMFVGFAGCALGQALISITLASGILFTVLSLVEAVGIGLLPPSILFLHSTYLCWYALSSNPDLTCNPWADADLMSASPKSVGVILSVGLLLATVAWCTWHGDKMLELFGVDEDSSLMTGRSQETAEISAERGEEDEVESRPSRVFYCFMMAGASAYAAMALTAWGRSDGSPESVGTTAAPLFSMWLKTLAQWACLILQARVIWVTYRDNRDTSYSYRRF